MTDILTLNGNVLIANGLALTGDDGGGSTEEDFSPGVDFIDYDGTTVERWAAADVASKTTLPSNPSHSRLTAQGWNWALADIKTYMTNHPDALMTVGQMYTTASGDTEIDCTFPVNSLHPYLQIAPDGTVEIDWGDGSTKDTLTGTSNTTKIYKDHTYAAAGNYTIKLHVTSGNFAFYSSNSGYISFLNISNSSSSRSTQYSSCVKAIWLGSGAKIGSSGLNYLINLKYLTIPKSITGELPNYGVSYNYNLTTIIIPNTITNMNNGSYVFTYCIKAKKISVPKGITTISSNYFSFTNTLDSFAIPDSVINIGSNMIGSLYNLKVLILSNSLSNISSAFTYCHSLKKLTIPASLTSISNSSFTYCTQLLELHFKSTAPPTLGGSSVFTYLPTNCKIYVPTGYLSAYTGATNYPDSSTYTYLEE